MAKQFQKMESEGVLGKKVVVLKYDQFLAMRQR
jgi:hypothetical protein